MGSKRVSETPQWPLLERWYQHVKAQPCMCCNSRLTVEVAHIEGFASDRVAGQMMPRSHKTIAAFSAIPLCAACHRIGRNSIHNAAESDWLEDRIAGGRVRAIGWIARSLTELSLEAFEFALNAQKEQHG
jgi:hypothetical protein